MVLNLMCHPLRAEVELKEGSRAVHVRPWEPNANACRPGRRDFSTSPTTLTCTLGVCDVRRCW